MANNSKIEWTSATWNPVTGCTKISSGCKNCYAERMAKRLQAIGHPNYKNGFKITCHSNQLYKPLSLKKGRLIFVNSMSDIFHSKVPLHFISEIFKVMNESPQHCFQILTKRSGRLKQLCQNFNWSSNIWMGVTVENQDNLRRIELLKETPAKIKFLSLEPLLGEIKKIDLNGIDWVIVGGESGPKSRPMQPEWVFEIKDICENYNVPFFFKQWGGKNKKKNGRTLAGKTWDEMPMLSTITQ